MIQTVRRFHRRRVYTHWEIASRHPNIFLRIIRRNPTSSFARTSESDAAIRIANIRARLLRSERLKRQDED